MPELKDIVTSIFNLPVSCYRHCNNQAELKFVSGEKNLLGCYVCPSGYVSRLIMYFKANEADPKLLVNLLSRFKDRIGEVKSQDIRIATRYSWDLNILSPEEAVFKEVYWTQGYKKTEQKNHLFAIFLCSNCNNLFSQPIDSTTAICENCRSS